MARIRGIVDQHPVLRWVAPVAAIAVAGAVAVATTAAARADDHPVLPPITAEQLLTNALQPTTQSLSGTVKVGSDLGLPQIPGLSGTVGGSGVVPGGAASIAAGSSSTSPALTGLATLLTGDHTLRVWADGPDRSRVAVITQGGESDVIRNGTDVWLWQSAGKQALHATLPATPSTDHTGELTPAQQQELQKVVGQLPTTPQQAAQTLLTLAGPTTDVTLDATTSVAGRSAYQIVATPKDKGTLVARVVVAIDAETHLPLRTEVYSTQRSAPAVTVGFTSVTFAAPSADTFTFTPPASTTLQQWQAPTTEPQAPRHATGTAPKVSTTGTGWATVVVAHLPADALPSAGGASTRPGATAGSEAGALSILPKVSGSWGTGHALSGTLFSVLVTDDGTVAAGAVPVATLEGALTGASGR
jgi:outer membrane lipoprotein-sorting protein